MSEVRPRGAVATFAVDATGWANPRGEGRFLRGLLPELAASLGEPLAPGPAGGLAVLCHADDAAAIDASLGGRATLLPLGREEQPGTDLAAGGRRPVGVLLRCGLKALRARPVALLQPSAVGWFPTPGVRQLVVFHDVKPPGGQAALFYPSRRDRLLAAAKQSLALRSAASVLAVSEASRTQLAASVPPTIPLGLLPVAVDRAFRPRSPAEIEQARNLAGLGEGARFVLVSSGLNRHKDPGLVLEALPLLDQMGGMLAGLDVVLVGAHRGSYGSTAPEVLARARRLGLKERLHAPGHVSDGTLAALYSDCEALVSASRFEGLGLSALEAAACGARAVLSDIPPHRETAGPGAKLFPVGDVGALAAALSVALAVPRPGPSARYSWAEAAARTGERLAAAAPGNNFPRSLPRPRPFRR